MGDRAMNEDQREQWRKALAANAAQHRRQRYRPRTGLLNVRAGMVRLPPAKERPAEAGRHTPRKG
jgi:hypothetical protein